MKNDIRETFESFRKALNEIESKDEGTKNTRQNGVPYTQQDELYQTSIETAKQQFGADFSKIKTPLIYYREDNDITLSGEIPSMKDAKFQFSFKANPDGCFFWSGNGQIVLTDDVLLKLKRMHGVYVNWVNEIGNPSDKKPMNMKDEEQ